MTQTLQTSNSYVNVSNEALFKATEKDWYQWIALLNQQKAQSKSHKEIVEVLQHLGVDSNWWRQKITLGYLTAMGIRKEGQAGQGFQIGVRKVFPLTVEKAWALITSDAGMHIWLNETATNTDEVYSELKVFNPHSHLRLRWKLPAWQQVSTIQIRVIPTGDRATISILHEHLDTESHRDEMRKHWKKVMSELLDLATA
ncbi:hypothetical protein LX64_00274 [Chitinophaga skermanii]|uniref:Activator of Hsp90 ATPase-like protein n=1 Tax=Chitinophaga skermanii TaxID=331697 RepID=A0A327R1E0_9BACT|nr:hypothetical protein [Chitinophaga skermanii]RAJ10669.1 hypothetical protein LX64_00274 [Chitinophaga skermanii]